MAQTALVVLLLTGLVSAENVGQFFANLGRGVENLANDVVDSVDRLVTANDDLFAAKRIQDQKAIDAYKRGEINDSQLKTALWLDQYEYQQAMDDRIRSQYLGGNSYPDLTGNYPQNSQYSNQQYNPPSAGAYPGNGNQGYSNPAYAPQNSAQTGPYAPSNGYSNQGYGNQGYGSPYSAQNSAQNGQYFPSSGSPYAASSAAAKTAGKEKI